MLCNVTHMTWHGEIMALLATCDVSDGGRGQKKSTKCSLEQTELTLVIWSSYYLYKNIKYMKYGNLLVCKSDFFVKTEVKTKLHTIYTPSWKVQIAYYHVKAECQNMFHDIRRKLYSASCKVNFCAFWSSGLTFRRQSVVVNHSTRIIIMATIWM